VGHVYMCVFSDASSSLNFFVDYMLIHKTWLR